MRLKCYPGTKDVDVLFEDGFVEKQLEPVIHSFLESGFLVSAKHKFQVLRVLRVAEEQCIFNVDLLHPSESTETPEMFVHHLDLNIFRRRRTETNKRRTVSCSAGFRDHF